MIAYLKGILSDKNPTYIIINCNGIGYHLNTSINSYSHFPDVGTECLVYTHLQVREDAHILYGFSSITERELFRQLISVSGVGPSTAIIILSSISAKDLFLAITENDVNMLKSIKGIGPKSAQRIILDLSDKIKKNATGFDLEENVNNTKRHEALSALSALGFNRNQAGKALDKVIQQTKDLRVEELIKQALKYL